MFEELLSRIGSALKKYGIPYMIIGGQAVLLYGEPRLTRDIDITLGVNKERLKDLLDILKEIILKPLPPNPESFVGDTMVLPCIDEITSIRVDFIFSYTPYEIQAIKRAHTVTLSDHGVKFASPEDVIIHKIFAGRPRDLEDVKSIIPKNPEIDRDYIRRWLREFDESTGGEGFLKTFEEILKDYP